MVNMLTIYSGRQLKLEDEMECDEKHLHKAWFEWAYQRTEPAQSIELKNDRKGQSSYSIQLSSKEILRESK